MIKNNFLYFVLFPLLAVLSVFFFIVVVIRNFLFDIGFIKSHSFDKAVICIGNITVGGTGKTPFTEFLISRLKNNYNTGVLSRGYKRSSKGFFVAESNSKYHETGDEPLQIKRKHPEATVCLDSNRVNGIRIMNTLFPELHLILLDDAFQHRYVKPCFSVVLIDYNRPIFADFIMPLGQLREPRCSVKRADIVIVTKCPTDFTEKDKDIFMKKLKRFQAKIFFSAVGYMSSMPVFPESGTPELRLNDIQEKQTPVTAVAGIANPKSFFDTIRKYSNNVNTIEFPDHHDFKNPDIEKIIKSVDKQGEEGIIITTEKDSVRLKECDIPEELKPKTFYVPVEIRILFNEEKALLESIKEKCRLS